MVGDSPNFLGEQPSVFDLERKIGPSSAPEEPETKVTYSENPIIVLSKNIKRRGYSTADDNRVKIFEPSIDMSSIGILKPKDCRGVLPERDEYVGRVILNDWSYDASPSKKWVLEVYGRKNIEDLTTLIKESSSPFKKVNIHIRLMTENPLLEKIPVFSYLGRLSSALCNLLY